MASIKQILAGLFLLAVVAAAPAHAAWLHWGVPFVGGANASGGISVPEPGNLGLFLMGVIGLAVGRRSSRARKRD